MEVTRRSRSRRARSPDMALRVAEIEQRMRLADAAWEKGYRFMQADMAGLATLQQRLENFRLLLTLTPNNPPGEGQAFAAQMEALEQ